MSKKKALDVNVIEIVTQIECNCPYCGYLNYLELPNGCEEEDELCVNCSKIFTVRIS